MTDTIQDYLAQLKKELRDCDRATIQDALSATEEHLNMALDTLMAEGGISREAALVQVIEEYGMPEEVAKAYRENEYRVTPVLTAIDYTEEPEKAKEPDTRPLWRKFFGIYTDPKAWSAMLYLLLSLATGIIYFTWTVTGISLSFGLLVLIVGLPFAALFILSIRGLGLLEGMIVESLLGIRMPRRHMYRRSDPGWWQRFVHIVSDRQTWFSIVYMIIKLPLGIFYFTLLVTLLSVSFYLMALPVLQLAFSLPLASINGVMYSLTAWMLPVAFIVGVILATLTMHLARYLGYLQGLMAKAMLVKFYRQEQGA